MKKIIFLFGIFTFFVIFSCNNNGNNRQNSDNDTGNNVSGNSELGNVYEGTINGEYQIVMFLANPDDENEIVGKYFYKNIGNEMILRGKITSDTLVLDEYNPSGEKTGEFIGVFSDNKITGEWSNDSKKFDFSLKKSNKSFEKLKPSSVLNKISAHDFKNFVINYAEIKLPVSYEYPVYADDYDCFIDGEVAIKYIDEDYMPEEWGRVGYTYGWCISTDNFIILMSPYYFAPGVGGVYRVNYLISTVDYDGNMLDSYCIGGSGVDNNYDEAYYDNSVVTIDENLQIVCKTANEYEDLETGETIKDKEIEKLYRIDADGSIIEAGETSAMIDTVETIKELAYAIEDNKIIYIQPGEYNVGDLNIGEQTLNIEGFSNLHFIGLGNIPPHITTDDEYSPVFTVINCDSLEITNLNLGHNVEKGSCTGSVINFIDCATVFVNNCILYGSGTYGIEANDCERIFINGTKITDCTYGILSLEDVGYFSAKNCEMSNNEDLDMFYLANCDSVIIDSCNIENNQATAYNSAIFQIDACGTVILKNSSVKNNVAKYFANVKDGFVTDNIIFLNNEWEKLYEQD